MNPFLNPWNTIPILKNYFFDPGRIERLNPEKLKQFKDKALRKMVSYAYNVPLYNQKYKEVGVHPNEIKGLEDIEKLPFITRKDMVDNFPDGIITPNFKKNKGYVICTGGTTGRYCCTSGSDPVCFYLDFPTLFRSVGTFLRVLQSYHFKWRKIRIAHLGNFNAFKYDEVYNKNVRKHLKSFSSFENMLVLDVCDPINKSMEKLDSFKPDVISSYPRFFHDLSLLKKKGYGKNIQPKLIISGGAVLDDYTRSYVEHIFNCKMVNAYASCEAGADIAYECSDGGWHINSDFFHIEAIDKNMESVSPGERGHIVLTRLWGGGTPMIRYTGMKDWVTLSDGKTCSCGSRSPIFEKPIEGRIMSNIILPNGDVYPPSEFLFISEVLHDLKTFKVKKYQIVQKKIDAIDINLVIDDELRNKGPSVKELIKNIKKKYTEKTGSDVTINVTEVKEIKEDPTTGKPAPLVLSKLDVGALCDMKGK